MPNLRNAKTRSQLDSGSSRTDRDFSPVEEEHDIKDPLGGRKFLERHLLLCPEGEPPTHTSLAACLYQVSAMAGISKLGINAIRSVAFLLEELEDTQINGMVKEAFDSQITEFSQEMRIKSRYKEGQ